MSSSKKKLEEKAIGITDRFSGNLIPKSKYDTLEEKYKTLRNLLRDDRRGHEKEVDGLEKIVNYERSEKKSSTLVK